MAQVVVISGTDAQVGKTFVAAALGRALVAQGHRVIALKPVECGPEGEESDAQILAESTLQVEPTEVLQRLKAPLVPPDAAVVENVHLEYGRWIGVIRGYSRIADFVLVETPGGLLSPLTWKENAVSMAKKLDARVVLVASDRLGTLNHAVLSMQALEAQIVPLAAVVFSAPLDSDRSTGRNATALARMTGFERIASVPGLKSWDVAAPLMGNIVSWIADSKET